MGLSAGWVNHIEAWQSSGLTQAAYCRAHSLNANTFSGRWQVYKKLRVTPSVLIPIRIEPAEQGHLVLQHRGGHRLELPTTQSAHWVAELLKCLD
jgi:hypothetical protein